MESLGKAIIHPGAPVGQSNTVSPSGVSKDGGANPLSGFTLVEAVDLATATDMAKGCPGLQNGGSVEVAEMMHM
ncbi:hypothetical protein [Roseovarius sp. Pro17]|uniref:hypothetical protein n=1 Tax=Roseovarius sp. Pro17 TaxID=3108175 RepID=UPI002D772ABF|nr:hypothetical protein [Roseovarius sp. Pro17]